MKSMTLATTIALIGSSAAVGLASAQDPQAQNKPAEKPQSAQQHDQQAMKQHDQQAMKQHDQQARQQIKQLTQSWPEGPRKEIDKMIEANGLPSGITQSRVIWDDLDGPFNEIVVYKDTIEHNWPVPHQDYLEHTVFYSVPEDKFDELAKFDGSVIAERTRGTLAARCHTEWANMIALNLAEDVINEEKTVEEARDAYVQAVKQQMSGEMPQIASKLMFEPMDEQQARNPAEQVPMAQNVPQQ